VRWLFTISVIPVSLFGWSEMQAINYASYSAQTYWAIGYVIIGATVLTYLLNNYGIKYSSPTVVSTYINAQPIIASLWAVSFGTDSPSVIHFAAASLVVLGVYLVSSPLRTTRKLLRSSLQAVAKKVGRSEY
jgi:drug/metabolite transporter (DMT)-like permease